MQGVLCVCAVCVCSSVCCRPDEPTYEAIWADKRDFNEVLISPTMINDHWPDNVLDALQKVRPHAHKHTIPYAPTDPLI